MTLEKYTAKRKFNVTPEPRGKVESTRGSLKFVIQKHQASHLHYDFRLEMEGVMKSWAVPKGPSLNPSDKRLAMMTEDHPMSYRTFEGTIPEGEYGAGDVIVWDEGTYEAEGAKSRKQSEAMLLEQLKRGDLKFIMHGQKVKGSFALVKMKGRQENAWLLIKHKDEFISKQAVVEDQSSVRSDIGLGDEPHAKIYRGTKTNQKRPAKKTPNLKRGRDRMPHSVSPMLATLADEPFNDPNWIYEIKWDGYRAVAEIQKGKAKLYSRNKQPFEKKYPGVVRALENIAHDVVLDGEVVALDKEGKSKFEYLQNYAHDPVLLQYQIFDLLYLDGFDLRDRPLIERKELLRQIVPQDSLILKFSDHIAETGKGLFAAATKQGLEGIMAKDSQSRYETGLRTKSWLKVKTHNEQEAIICGYTEPRRSRKYFGAIILGVYRNGELTYIGHTGTGFNDESLKYLYNKLQKIKLDKSPFSRTPKTNQKPTWVKPELVCQIEFTEWTKDGQMRHPSFKGLREDKTPKAVNKETPMPTNKEEKFTNLKKVYWPKEGYTKGDVIEYYRKIAPVILPYLKNRPQSMHRFPNGIKGKSFFQKDYQNEVPAFVNTFEFFSESNDKDLRWLVCNNQDTLLFLANLGCIEINPWNSTTKNPNTPPGW